MDIFESGHFKEYRNEDLINQYKEYFKNVSLCKKLYNYRRRSLRHRESEYDRLSKESSIEDKLSGLQQEFIDRIQKIAQSDKYVFMSHKHSDLIDVLDIACFLSRTYHIGAYIDCFDNRQPLKTSVETAIRIKKVIEKSHRFLFMATNGAIASKWCNWELGYGDSLKHQNNQNHLAFWAMRNTAVKQGNFKGNEYMEMYPFIFYQPGAEGFDSHGYSVRIKDKSYERFIPLEKWLA